MSYIFMKILEKSPERYNKGINILSMGQAESVRNNIVQTHVTPNTNMLDIGCGTGELVKAAAERGANVVGIDISKEMLSAARKRIDENDFVGEVTLHQAGVDRMDELFNDDSFDLVTSTFVFSEFYEEERLWTLEQIRRVLEKGGKLVLADEIEPRQLLGKIFHFLLRLPFALVTYIMAQKGTKPLPNISKEISGTGFKIINEKSSFFGSFAIITAEKC